MNLLKLKNHLDKFLILYVAIAMVIGFFAGLRINVKNYSNMLKTLNLVVVISMIYPMMINLKIEAMGKAAKSWKQVITALIVGLVVAPLLVWVLNLLFHVNPTLSLGLLLAVVVPCSSMAIAYTGLSDGNLELATIVVALSFTLAIITVPGWLKFFAGSYHLSISAWLLIKTIIIVVIIPLFAGYLTRIGLLKKMGLEGFEKIKPLFPSISIFGMFAIVALIFMEKAKLVVSKPGAVAISLVPLTLYYVISLLALTYFDKKIGINYEDHMAVVFTSVGKNEGTAMAIAMAAGMGLMAIPPAITPVLQIPFLVGYLKLAPKVKNYFYGKRKIAEESREGNILSAEDKISK